MAAQTGPMDLRTHFIFDKRFVALLLGVAVGLFHLYTGFFGLFSATTQRSVHWGLLGCMVFLLHPWRKGDNSFRLSLRDLVDLALIAGLAGSSVYLVLYAEELALNFGMPEFPEIFWGTFLLVITLEGARRCSGLALPIVSVIFLAYAYFGPYMPGLLRHKGYSLERIVSYMYTTSNGIYGIPIGVSASFIILFVLFGAFLNVSGAGKFFMDFSFALTGRFVGGAAKTAVVSSALMGTMSGSPIANAVTTGTITIPLMKESGYSTNMACAVEAVASTGGMIMPPVMGAAAFIMAEYLGVSYFDVAVAALIPSLIYFTAVYFMVDTYARKYKVAALDEAHRPGLKKTLRERGHLAIPIICLILFLFWRWSPMKAVFWSIILLIALSWLRKGTRITPKKFIDALWDGSKGAVPVACACACAGIILGVVSLTGIGSTMSGAIFSMFSGNLIGALIAGMVISLVLGMGLPATAVYLILATLVAPSLIDLGVTPMAAHMFVFYYGIISTITPPVALTAYAAAGVGGGDATKVGFIAFRLGIAAYIIPFILVYSPALLFDGPLWEILLRSAISLVAVYALSIATIGYMRGPMSPLVRLAAFAAGLLLITPDPITDILGVVLTAVIILRKNALAKLGKAQS